MTRPVDVSAALQPLVKGTDQLLGRMQTQQEAVEEIRRAVSALEQQVTLLTYTGTALQQLLKVVSVESLESVEKLVTYGLRTIFADQALTFRIEVTTKRGLQWYEPKILQGSVEAPILDAFGGGPATVVAFLLRVLVCRRLGLAPVILLDEAFSMVSREYQSNVARLLRELADKLGLVILLVTHTEEFVEFAHHAYRVEETAGGTVFRPIEPERESGLLR